MPIETKPWDAAEVLDSPAAIAAYLDAYLEDGTPEELLGALNTIARSRGMSALDAKPGSAAKRSTARSATTATRRSTHCYG